MLVGSIQLTSPSGGAFSLCKTAQRYYVYPLIGNQDSAPKCHLTVAPLSLYPFPSLISNSLNLPIFLCVCVCLATPHDRWDLSSLTRDRTYAPCIGKWSLNHWTTKEVPRKSWGLNEAYSCNQEMGYTERLLCLGAPKSLAWFQWDKRGLLVPSLHDFKMFATWQ